jgi:FKBP-type peptidyl-prolyl cis-trans isomerase 2
MMNREKVFRGLMGLLLALSCFMVPAVWAEEGAKGDVPVVSEGKQVKVHYTLKVDGEVVDSSKEREPLEVKIGSQQVIPGFEKALMGMKAGEKKSFQVTPEEGYGHEDPRAVQEIPRDKLPPDREPEVGMKLFTRGPQGEIITGKIVEVREDVVVMDFNHPLAGKTLDFDVEVVEIKD